MAEIGPSNWHFYSEKSSLQLWFFILGKCTSLGLDTFRELSDINAFLKKLRFRVIGVDVNIPFFQVGELISGILGLKNFNNKFYVMFIAFAKFVQ